MNENIKAKIILDSEFNGYRLTTMELNIPRFILAELTRHRVFSFSVSSSRAIPVRKMISNLQENHFIPQYWGHNQEGMVASKEIEPELREEAIKEWENAFNNALQSAWNLINLGVHKQLTNRLLEPFSYCKVLITGTEWDNFFNLRCSKYAQPEMEELANKMKDAYLNSKPVKRHIHLPFVYGDNNLGSNEKDILKKHNLEKLYRLSSARCARISYLNHNNEYSIDKDLELANKLISMNHCFTPNHEILTNKGWVKFENLIGDELIAGFDTSTGLFKGYEKPIKIINKDYQGKIYSWNNDDIEVSFTDQHKLLGVLFRTYSDRKKSYESLEIINPSKIEYLTKHQNEKTNGEREMIMFSAGKTPQINNQNLYHKGQLIGFFIGDGFKEYKNVIQFRLKKKRKIEYLNHLIKNLNLEFKLRVDKQGVYNFYIHNSFITGSEFYNEENRKCFPNTNYSIDELLGIFDGLKNSDGSVKRKTWCYSSMSKQLVEQIKCLAPLIGLTVREYKQDKNNCYRLYFTTNNHIRLNDSRRKDSQVSITDYSGSVYCVEIPSNGIMIRKNGKTLLTHNCSPQEHCCISSLDKLSWRNLKGWLQFRVMLEEDRK